MLPRIVDGRLWTTVVEDIATTTMQTAKACARLDAGEKASGLHVPSGVSDPRTRESDGVKTATEPATEDPDADPVVGDEPIG